MMLQGPPYPRRRANSGSTIRKRRYRARLRDGLIVVDLEVSLDVIELLLDTNYLALELSEDRGAIAVAVKEMLGGAAKDR